MNGRVAAHEHGRADDTGFAVAPEAPGNGFAVGLQLERQIETAEQRVERGSRDVGYSQDHLQAGYLLQNRPHEIANDCLA